MQSRSRFVGGVGEWLLAGSFVRWAFGALTLLASCAPAASACGIVWQRPVSHFDGVDEQGHVSYSEKVGELDLGEGLTLPLFIIFNSSWEASSPYLGKGWNLCLLESRLEQVDENTFKLVQPDGWYRMFGRGKSTESVLSGQGGWKAEIKDETITAYADCGWKLSFNKGRIASMTTAKNRRLDWVYEGRRVSEVREGSVTRLQVEYGADGQTKALTLPEGKRILLAQGPQPRIQALQGQRVVAGLDASLHEVTLVGGGVRRYEFGASEQTQPTLAISGNTVGGPTSKQAALAVARTFGWDAATKRILSDGDWTYQITLAATPKANAAIGRKDTQDRSEFWKYDDAQGEEITQGLDGVKTITSWFTSGALAGAIRKRQRITGNQSKTIYQASYDANGKLFREIFEDGTVSQFKYNNEGIKFSETRYEKGKPVYSADFQSGRITAVRSADGRSHQYYYDDKGREIKMLINGKQHSQKTYAPDASWEEEIIFDDGSGNPSRTFRREFNTAGKVTLDKIIEHSGNYPEIIKRYFYDGSGQLEKQISSQAGTILYFDDWQGGRIGKLADKLQQEH